MSQDTQQPPAAAPTQFQIGAQITPTNEVTLLLAVGPATFAVSLGAPDQAEQIGKAIENQIWAAATQARRQASGLHLPGMPGFPTGQLPGAQPLPPGQVG